MTDNLKRIEEFQRAQRVKAEDTERAEATSAMGQVFRELNIYQKFARQVASVAIWLWWNFGSPVLNAFTIPVFKWVAEKYMAFWNRFAFSEDKFGQRRLHYRKAGVILAGTLVAPFVTWMGLLLTLDTAIYFGTVQTHEVYLFKPSDNTFDGDNFSVTGCKISTKTTGFTCPDSETLYYRVNPTLFNNLWSISHKGNLFLPEYIAGAVSPDWNRCMVTEKGFRFYFWVRYFQQWPELLSISCSPIDIRQGDKVAG